MEITELSELIIDSSHQVFIFDCFGTLFNITKKTNPYEFLYNNSEHNFKDLKEFKQEVMTSSFKKLLHQIKIEPSDLEMFVNLLTVEINSIKLYPEAMNFLNNLKKENKQIYLCSNLAEPYGVFIKKMNLGLINIFSYEVQTTKPDAKIFQLCYNNKFEKSAHIFIGDNPINDYQAATNFGFQSVLLKRL